MTFGTCASHPLSLFSWVTLIPFILSKWGILPPGRNLECLLHPQPLHGTDADRLFLAEGTVKNEVSATLEKTGVRDRTQAALRARELGVV